MYADVYLFVVYISFFSFLLTANVLFDIRIFLFRQKVV